MSEEEFFAEFMGSVMERMTWHLVQIAIDDPEDTNFETCRSGGQMHLRVKNSKNEVCLQVSGKDIHEVASQLVLACLHNISIEKLREFHKRRPKRVLQLAKAAD